MNKTTLRFGIAGVAVICMASSIFGRNSDAASTKGATVSKSTTVIIETSMGKIVAELDAVHAPISVANFLKYVDSDFYSGTIFHRVIPGFMIQGGGMDENLKQKDTNPPIKNEAENGLKNVKYSLAMARTGVVDSATAQFFINNTDNPFLDHSQRDFGYAVFGKVISGQDVVDKISAVPTTTRMGNEHVPVTPVKIISIKRK